MTDRSIEIHHIKLLEKKGGKSGRKDAFETRIRTAVVVCSDTVSKGDKADTSGKAIIEKLEGHPVEVIGYVNGAQVLVGIVHEMSLVRRRTMNDAPVTMAMSSALALDEGTSIRDALRLLASTHSRAATVVTAEGKPLGVFRDIDGMGWIARARRDAPPEE